MHEERRAQIAPVRTTGTPQPPPAAVDTPPVPRLLKARDDVLRLRQNALQASAPAHALQGKINALVARRKRLTAARAKLQTVEALRQLKAELVDVEDELEILERQYEPLEKSAREIGQTLKDAKERYQRVHVLAVDAFKQARRYWLRGIDPRDKERFLAELDAFVGATEGSAHVQRLTLDNQHLPEPAWLSETVIL
jgi:prefoldin subunit 5